MSLTVISEAVAADPNRPAADIARDVLDKLEAEQWFELLVIAIDSERRRHSKQAAEHGWRPKFAERLANRTEQKQPTRSVIDPTAEQEHLKKFRSLCNQKFKLGDGKRGETTYGQATADQHEFKAAFHERKAAGEMQSARRHREMADVIRSNNVRCLDDLFRA